ncbi:hypothetical protein [Marilutibacter alkalisoli]|uniref:Uncharacterized protein n=1 Tax=Marilutibacter alkalisoli TaxID=2591633 RepID=A0A514BQE3_9GAMM|nr:hypothetical protein [Lysobacter alkalisoli]QDH69622.1 hypothetical protein FKV23_05595 [Lysobacter alkalisoli]
MKTIKGHRIIRESSPVPAHAGLNPAILNPAIPSSAIERAENEGWPIPPPSIRPDRHCPGVLAVPRPAVRKHAAWLWLRGSTPASWRAYRSNITQSRG